MSAPVDVLAVMDADARAARADRLAQARMSSHSVEESQRAQALWSRSIDARAAVAELIEIAQALANTVDEDGDRANGTHYVDADGRIRCKGSYLALVARAEAALARVGGTA